MADDRPAPIVSVRQYDAPSAFTPESLLREARRQKDLGNRPVPSVCMLDPDGDVVLRVQADGRSKKHPDWACYHTELHVFEQDGVCIGVIGCAVGASFAVLVAEQLFASGCEYLISVTSAGQLAAVQEPPYFILIDRALRDEGTSYHYRPPDEYSRAPTALLRRLEGAFEASGIEVLRGSSWTTDAPFRETEAAIAAHCERGLLAVEMEAAALYALAEARQRNVICFAHVTNQMGRIEGDFEKGEADGVTATLKVVARCAHRLHSGAGTGTGTGKGKGGSPMHEEFTATSMPDRDWWSTLWPEPQRVLRDIGLRPEMMVLDLCCGDGYFTAPLAAWVGGQVYALDLDPSMLDRAKAAVDRQGVSVRQWICADARDVGELLPERVDYVLMANTFHGVPDQRGLLSAMRSVLSAKGRLGLVNWHRLPREQTTVLGRPRGPATAMRMSVEDARSIVEAAGFRTDCVVELPPYHYGAVFERSA